MCWVTVTPAQIVNECATYYVYPAVSNAFLFVYLNSLFCSFSLVSHLKGAQAQLDVESGCYARVLRQEGKYGVVHSEQRDEEQGGFSQPPAGKDKQRDASENKDETLSPDNDATASRKMLNISH